MIQHRKLVVEWFDHARVQEKKEMENYAQFKEIDDYENAEKMAEEITKSSKISPAELSSQLRESYSEMKTQTKLIKKFMKFWEEVSIQLKSNKFFRKRLKLIITGLKNDLERKYRDSYPQEWEEQESKNQIYSIDTLELLFGLIRSSQTASTTSTQSESKYPKIDA